MARVTLAGLALAAFFLPGVVSPAIAQGADVEPELKPAPDYFIDAVVATTTAQQIVRFCDALSLNIPEIQDATQDIMLRLNSDGFDVSRADGGMLDPGERIREQQEAFMLRHELNGVITDEMVCAAGRAEIADNTMIGNLLIEDAG